MLFVFGSGSRGFASRNGRWAVPVGDAGAMPRPSRPGAPRPPGTARRRVVLTLDWLALTLLVATVALELTGGFFTHIGGVRVSARAVDRPFLQVVYDVEVSRMAFGRVCLIGDAAWVVRPHAAAGTAKAAADAWTLADALAAHDDVPSALTAWEPGQLALGRQLLERTRRIGARSQVECNWQPGDPELIFGLYGPGR